MFSHVSRLDLHAQSKHVWITICESEFGQYQLNAGSCRCLACDFDRFVVTISLDMAGVDSKMSLDYILSQLFTH